MDTTRVGLNISGKQGIARHTTDDTIWAFRFSVFSPYLITLLPSPSAVGFMRAVGDIDRCLDVVAVSLLGDSSIVDWPVAECRTNKNSPSDGCYILADGINQVLPVEEKNQATIYLKEQRQLQRSSARSTLPCKRKCVYLLVAIHPFLKQKHMPGTDLRTSFLHDLSLPFLSFPFLALPFFSFFPLSPSLLDKVHPGTP